jgi:DNA-binding SARP family transcriptional activator
MIHALCNVHSLRELIYVTDAATGEVADHAQQAITALRRLNRLVVDARAADQTPDPEQVTRYLHIRHSAVVLGAQATATRASKLERKHDACSSGCGTAAMTTYASSSTPPYRSTATPASARSACRNCASRSPAAYER